MLRLCGKEIKGRKTLAAAIVIIALILTALIYFLAERADIRRSETVYGGISIANEDEVVKAIRHGLTSRASGITVSFKAYTDDLSQVGGIVRDLMGKAMEDTGDPVQGDYIRFQMGGYEIRYENKGAKRKYEYTVRIIPDYYTYAEWEEEVDGIVAGIMESFKFDETTTDYEKVKAIYDYVYENVSYDSVHKKNENNHLKTTAYSALVYKTAVCQGYAVLLYRLFKEAGLDSRVITGTAVYEGNEEYHAWNIVGIDGKYYDLDATWDRSVGSNDHFLKCDADFDGHIRDEEYDSEEFRSRYVMSDVSWPG